MFKSGLEKAAMTADEAHAAFGHLAPKDGVSGSVTLPTGDVLREGVDYERNAGVALPDGGDRG